MRATYSPRRAQASPSRRFIYAAPSGQAKIVPNPGPSPRLKPKFSALRFVPGGSAQDDNSLETRTLSKKSVDSNEPSQTRFLLEIKNQRIRLLEVENARLKIQLQSQLRIPNRQENLHPNRERAPNPALRSKKSEELRQQLQLIIEQHSIVQKDQNEIQREAGQREAGLREEIRELRGRVASLTSQLSMYQRNKPIEIKTARVCEISREVGITVNSTSDQLFYQQEDSQQLRLDLQDARSQVLNLKQTSEQFRKESLARLLEIKQLRDKVEHYERVVIEQYRDKLDLLAGENEQLRDKLEVLAQQLQTTAEHVRRSETQLITNEELSLENKRLEAVINQQENKLNEGKEQYQRQRRQNQTLTQQVKELKETNEELLKRESEGFTYLRQKAVQQSRGVSQQHLQELQRYKADLKKIAQELEKLSNQYEEARRQNQTLKNKVAAASNELRILLAERQGESSTQSTRLQQLQSACAGLTQEKEDLQLQVRQLSARANSRGEQLKKYHNMYQNQSKELKVFREMIDNQSQLIIELQANQAKQSESSLEQQLREALDRESRLSSNLYSYQQIIEGFKHEVDLGKAEARRLVQELQQENSELRQRILQLQTGLEDAESYAQELKVLLGRRVDENQKLESELLKCQKIAKNQGELEHLKAVVAQCRQRLAQSDKGLRMLGQNRELMQQNQSLKAEVGKLLPLRAQRQQLQQELAEAKKKWKSESNALKFKVEDLQFQSKQLRLKEKEVQNLRREKEEYRQKCRSLKQLLPKDQSLDSETDMATASSE